MRNRRLAILVLLSLVTGTTWGQNLIQNPGFETGLEPWSIQGAISITQSSEEAHSGNFSLLVSNRTELWHGPLQSLLNVLEPGRSYRVSAWVKIKGDTQQPINMTIAKTDDDGLQYINVINSRAFPDHWVELTEIYEHSENGELTLLYLYLQNPEVGVDFYVDDVFVEALPEDWKTAANLRIDDLRKRDLAVTVLNANGDPVEGATVQMQQLSRDFPIGTAINTGVHAQNHKYRDYIAKHFNWAVHENAAKWPSNEPTQGDVSYAGADAVLEWAEANDIRMRGHTIFWAPEQWQPGWVTGLNNADLSNAVEQRMESAVTYFRGRFAAWDVNNEMLHGSFFKDRLGEDTRKWMYERSREIDPQVELFVNDYSVLSGPETDLYTEQIKGFLEQGFPLDAIGAQGHFDSVNPWAIQTRLDKMAQFGLPIWVTEFDVVDADENKRADQLETFFRSAYSHPAVDGIMLWGFWTGAHWKGSNAALIDLDWNLNAAGKRFEALLSEWTSNETTSTQADGTARARVFHGEYEIRVTGPDGLSSITQIEVRAGAGEKTVSLILDYQTEAPLVLVREFGVAGSDASGFNSPRGVALNSSDQIIIADTLNNRIKICEPDGTCRSFGTAGSAAGQFCEPTDVAVDSKDWIIVADSCNHRIQVCDDKGECFAFGNIGQFDNPQSIAVDSSDRVIVADTFNGRIQVCDSNGDCEVLGSLVTDPDNFQAGEFGFIQDVSIDQQDRILLSEDIGATARKGMHSCYRGECNLVRIFERPRSVAVDRYNRIHVIENTGLHRCDHAGRCKMINVIEPIRSGSQVAFTSANEIVITDPEDHRVRIYAANSALMMNAGLNDAWFNPEASGQGFFLTVFPVIGGASVAWFTYDTAPPAPDAIANLGAPEHRWFTGFGYLRQNRVEMDIELTKGGLFDSTQPAPERSSTGRLILQFEDCKSATVSYELPGIGAYLRVIPLQRVAGDNITLCELLAH